MIYGRPGSGEGGRGDDMTAWHYIRHLSLRVDNDKMDGFLFFSSSSVT